jgi:selenide,water dikinase
MEQFPFTRDLVLVGGGHAHALILRRWGMDPLPGVRLTVIDPAPEVAYSGMLPGFVAGHYSRDDLMIDLVPLVRFASARLILGPATGIDTAAHLITVPGRPPVAYDLASVDIGITSAMPDIPGFAAHAHPVKPLAPFAAAWSDLLARDGAPQVAVIGGGLAGAELAMAMAHRLAGRGAVHLVERGRALAALGPGARARALTALRGLGVTLHEGRAVTAVLPDGLQLNDGRHLRAGFVCGAAGACAQDWLATTGLALKDGFIAVDRYLRSSDPAIFAAGDCAHMTASPRPKAGVFAVRQAPLLFHNLRAALAGGPLRPFRPQRDYLKLVSLGDRRAIAEKWGLSASGPAIWRWKDRIDRRFTDRLARLPAMPAPAVPRPAARGLRELMGEAPPCGGCGAKVGRGVLTGSLSALPSPRADVDRLPGDDAALLRTGQARQVITTDHLRAVTLDPVLMTRIAAIHALGDIWAMAAAPQAALMTLVLPRMSADLQSRTLAEIMATAAEVIGAAGAALAGGHTSQGEEFTIGFTLTGLIEGDPVTLAGARPGDALILTRPVGSGVILAADMRRVARGADVAACHATMIRPQDDAARILRNAHAMTDVTGFGLAGHLAGLCDASGLAAEVQLGDVPLLAGAEALAARGIRSTLWADNRSGAGPVFGASGPRGDLMFDPQTCGGLLAAVDQRQAPALLSALRATGCGAAVIGRLVEGRPAVTFR